MTIAIGQIIDNIYRIERLIAAGGFGVVYEATHLSLNARVALKVMDASIAQRPDFQARFLREAQSAAQLSHPNIVKVTHVANWQGLLYLVMELVEHGSLRARLDRYKQAQTPVPFGFALGLVHQAAEGLDEAHSKGMIHRDIKPENLLLHYVKKPNGSTHCTLKITDFGLVQLMQAAGGQLSRTPMATIDYASPEQLQLAALDGRSDVFSLAIVAYEMLTGQKPYGEALDWMDALARRQTIAPPPPQALRPEVPLDASTMLMRCVSYDPALRPTAGELALALNGTSNAAAVGAPQTIPLAGAAPGALTNIQPVQGGLTSAPTHRATQTPSIWPRLRVREGQGQARSYDLTTAGLTLGRDAACSIALADNDVSRRHLALAWDGSQVLVTDLGSSNGSTLGGQRLPGRFATPWPWNAPVRIGSCILQISPPTLSAQGPAATNSGTRTQRWTQRLNQAQTIGSRLAIDVGPGEDALQLAPGQPIAITLLLANLGPQIDHVTLSIEGAPADWINLPTRPQQLEAAGRAGSEISLPLTISIPQRPEVKAGDYQVKLRARSGVNQTFSTTVDLTWIIQPFLAGELSIAPKRSRSSSSSEHTLTLLNNGNTSVTYSLSAEDDELALGYRFARDSVTLQPGDEAQVKMMLTAKQSNVIAERTHEFTVTARPSSGAALTAQGEFVQEAVVAAPRPAQQPAPTPARVSWKQPGKVISRRIGWFRKLLLTLVVFFVLRPFIVFLLGAIGSNMRAEPFYTAAIIATELLNPFPDQKPYMDRAYFFLNNSGGSDDEDKDIQAIADFYSAIRIDEDGPWSARAYYNIGLLRENHGDIEWAIESYEAVIRTDPSGILCDDAWSAARELDPQYSGPECSGL